MAKRSSIPSITQRVLWSWSMGRCFNPECKSDLFPHGTSIGQFAHIDPWAKSQDNSLANLLILCPSCHTLVDKDRTQWPNSELLRWQQVRKRELDSNFNSVSTFEELRQKVNPLFRRNGAIFASYGPAKTDVSDEVRRELWMTFEPELLANNQQLATLLSSNRSLFHKENARLVDAFSNHVAEFVATRGSSTNARALLFPNDLLSVFGIAQSDVSGLPPSVAALQNFIKHLMEKGSFIELSLTPDQRLTYSHDGRLVELNLNDRPRMQQIFFSYRFFHPQTTKVQLKDLVWVLQWMDRIGINYAWKDLTRLTELVVANRYFVKFCHSYTWSDVDEAELTHASDAIAVNLFGWNKPDVDLDVVKETSEVGLHYLNQKEFMEFCRRILNAKESSAG